MDIHDTLQEARDLVDNGRARAFGTGVVVDRERLLQLLDHAQSALPEEILAAASILAQRAQIMTTAQEEAEQITAAATEEAERSRANGVADAQEMRQAAEAEARHLRDRSVAEREALLDEHEVLLEARRRADEELARAQQQSTAMRAEVDAYVEAKLAAIATTLARTLETIEAGRRKVGAQREAVAADALSASH